MTKKNIVDAIASGIIRCMVGYRDPENTDQTRHDYLTKINTYADVLDLFCDYKIDRDYYRYIEVNGTRYEYKIKDAVTYRYELIKKKEGD